MLKSKIAVILAIVGLIVANTVSAQSTSALRINEVLTNNTENYVDQFGNRGAWIEIYNSSAGSVEMAGCYISIDENNPKMYMVSKGDVNSRIRPRQRILIWADAMPHHGVFHTNFALKTDQPNTITIFDASGKKMIDQVTVPVLPPNTSYGRKVDGGQEMVVLQVTTPEAANFVENGNPSVEKFLINDPNGVGMSMTAMLVVFLALIVLYLLFQQIGKLSIMLSARRANAISGKSTAGNEEGLSAELIAAISLALHEHEEEAHDFEETVLTINRVTRNYSPWSSKIYGLRELPKK